MKVAELEVTLLDQIEKLNDDSILADPASAKVLIDRSMAMKGLTDSYIEMTRVKLDIVRELRKGDEQKVCSFLGIEDGKQK